MDMTADEGLYEQARQKLLALVLARNNLLLQLDGLTLTPLNLTPSSGLIGEFDSATAHKLIDEVDRLASQIDEIVAEANRLAPECGKPRFGWHADRPPAGEH